MNKFQVPNHSTKVPTNTQIQYNIEYQQVQPKITYIVNIASL